MRYILFMLPNAGDDYGTPSVEAVKAMTAYNQELADAGVLDDLNGLHPPSEGFRVTWPNGEATIADGPFPEASDVVGGYWIIDVASREDAAAWALKIPGDPGNIVEVREIFALEDFPDDVQAAAALDRKGTA